MGRRFFTTSSDGWTTVSRRRKEKLVQPSQNHSRRQVKAPSIKRLFTKSPPVSSTDSLPFLSSKFSTNYPHPAHQSVSPDPFKSSSLTSPQSPSAMANPAQPSDPFTSWYYTDPLTKKAFETNLFLTGKYFLHPTDYSRPGWTNRCYTCLVRGHSSATCRAPVRACTRCFKPGHGAGTCPKLHQPKPIPSLVPRGNIGPDKLPRNRPNFIDVFLPQSYQNINDLRYLNKGVVIDGRLKPGRFNNASIQAALMMVTDTLVTYPLVHLNADRYLFLLPEEKDRSSFLSSYKKNFETIGLVAYPWSPAIDTEPIKYRFKVLIDLLNVPIQAWNSQHLLPLIGQFGLLLDHTPFEGVTSIEKLRVLVAVRKLEEIPHAARLTDRFLRKSVPIEVVSWIEEPYTATTPADPTLKPRNYLLPI